MFVAHPATLPHSQALFDCCCQVQPPARRISNSSACVCNPSTWHAPPFVARTTDLHACQMVVLLMSNDNKYLARTYAVMPTTRQILCTTT